MKESVKEKVIEKIKEYTGHKYVHLTNCGDSAVFLAYYIVKKTNPKAFVLVPDQGGWLTYPNYPKILNFDVKKLETDYGVVKLKELEKQVKKVAAFITQNPAGYFAEQPMKYIHELCKDKCILIEDVTGSLGSELCNGEYADIMIGSFGKWKPINIGDGGFISTNNQDYFVKVKDIFSLTKTKLDYKDLLEKLENVSKKYEFYNKTREKIINDLNKYDILHKDKKGINVVVKYKDDKEKQEVIKYCKKSNLEYTECPRYIRVEEQAISIEVKRLDV